jgi:hypothetical protein
MSKTRIKFEDPTRRDWVVGILYLVVFLVVIGVGAFLLIPDHWFWWLALVLGGTLLLALNQNKKYGCRCRSCGHEFKIGFFTNLISPHGVDKKGSWLWVQCPGCEEKGKVTVIRAVRDRSPGGDSLKDS